MKSPLRILTITLAITAIAILVMLTSRGSFVPTESKQELGYLNLVACFTVAVLGLIAGRILSKGLPACGWSELDEGETVKLIGLFPQKNADSSKTSVDALVRQYPYDEDESPLFINIGFPEIDKLKVGHNYIWTDQGLKSVTEI